MRIINVIEIFNGQVIQMLSYPIYDEQLSQDQVDLAEAEFSSIAAENGVSEEDIESYLEDGRYEHSGGNWSVNLVWSNTN